MPARGCVQVCECLYRCSSTSRYVSNSHDGCHEQSPTPCTRQPKSSVPFSKTSGQRPSLDDKTRLAIGCRSPGQRSLVCQHLCDSASDLGLVLVACGATHGLLPHVVNVYCPNIGIRARAPRSGFARISCKAPAQARGWCFDSSDGGGRGGEKEGRRKKELIHSERSERGGPRARPRYHWQYGCLPSSTLHFVQISLNAAHAFSMPVKINLP